MAQSRARNLCIAAVACIAVLAGGSLLLKTPSPTPSGTDSAQQTRGTDANLPEPLLVQELTEADPSYSLDDAAARAGLIVTGTIVSEGASLLVKPVHEDADPRFFTDRTFKVDSVLKGSPAYSKGKGITLRTPGGRGTYVEMSNGSAPELNQGDNYLLFLYSIPDGSSYNTEGDHYYILGCSSGAWKQAGEGDAYVNPSELEDNRNVTTDDVTTAVKKLPPNGDEDSNSGAQATIEQIEQDYQNGSLSDEAYRDYLEIAQKEASSFATVLTGDEALAAEEEMLGASGIEIQATS
ncbi:hypothetical protein [Collinsella tanakaei]|uniref:hypothetical protein n=1 Tax=Collinsella tanakaei TaxID=626935 RepID=UPI00242046A9|nr:hypothetical protein [Collinsella tanakaei]